MTFSSTASRSHIYFVSITINCAVLLGSRRLSGVVAGEEMASRQARSAGPSRTTIHPQRVHGPQQPTPIRPTDHADRGDLHLNKPHTVLITFRASTRSRSRYQHTARSCIYHLAFRSSDSRSPRSLITRATPPARVSSTSNHYRGPISFFFSNRLSFFLESRLPALRVCLWAVRGHERSGRPKDAPDRRFFQRHSGPSVLSLTRTDPYNTSVRTAYDSPCPSRRNPDPAHQLFY